MFTNAVRMRAPIVLQKVMEQRNDSECTGACLTAWQAEIPEVIVSGLEVCQVTNGKVEKYRGLSVEKVTRTYAMHSERGDISSFQSMDPDNEKYQGGVLLYDSDTPAKRRFIFAFSGLAAEDDEAACLLLGITLGMTRESADAVAAISQNQAYYDLVEWASALKF